MQRVSVFEYLSACSANSGRILILPSILVWWKVNGWMDGLLQGLMPDVAVELVGRYWLLVLFDDSRILFCLFFLLFNGWTDRLWTNHPSNRDICNKVHPWVETQTFALFLGYTKYFQYKQIPTILSKYPTNQPTSLCFSSRMEKNLKSPLKWKRGGENYACILWTWQRKLKHLEHYDAWTRRHRIAIKKNCCIPLNVHSWIIEAWMNSIEFSYTFICRYLFF